MGARIYYIELYKFQRQEFIEKNLFYFEQTRRRLLSQFSSLEEDAKERAEQYLERTAPYFDPENDDPDDALIRAGEAADAYFLQLDGMLRDTRLSVAAGMFQAMEKSLREWLYDEMVRYCRGRFKPKFWTYSVEKLLNDLVILIWNNPGAPFMNDLERCRMLVNTYKHGFGPAFLSLMTMFPQHIRMDAQARKAYLAAPDSVPPFYGQYLEIDDADIAQFSEAIDLFWKSIPEHTDSNLVKSWLLREKLIVT